MTSSDHYAIYRSVISRVLNDSERLPSLPSITLKIRQAMAEESTTAESLAQIITKDPALSALLLKSASSPLYKRAVAPNTLAEVIGLLGFANTNNLVMLHSVRSVFVMSSPKAKTLFAATWKRLIVKIALCIFIAKKVKFHPVEHAQMVALLSELGSLAVLSALIEQPQIPNSETYIKLCRHYSKSLGSILLNKWNIDSYFIDVIKNSGNWQHNTNQEITLLDVVNLALYFTVRMTNSDPQLPALKEIGVYQKLPQNMRACTKENWLDWVVDNRSEIQEIVKSFK